MHDFAIAPWKYAWRVRDGRTYMKLASGKVAYFVEKAAAEKAAAKKAGRRVVLSKL